MYGGAFDPPHLAHSALAEAAIAQYGLDELRIVPTGHAWHKSRTLCASEHRLAMARLAFAGLPQAVVDACETQRSGPTYTIDTLLELRREQPGAQLFLLMGQDQMSFFPHWHRYAEIVPIATILVAVRADSEPPTGPKSPENSAKIAYQSIPMPAMALSATDIRHRVQTQQPISHLVNPAVARYIDDHRLYRHP
jgi:nicotinate-nucleotide adenylyltransferase